LEKGFKHIYFGSIVRDEVKKRGQEETQENERKVREELRKQYGMGAMATMSLPKIKKLSKEGNVVIESMYSWEEYKIVKKAFPDFKVLAIFTPKALRYKRLTKRKERGLSEQEAFKRDIAELENLNKGNPIAFADYTVFNQRTIEDLRTKIAELIDTL
jgi:dephospho-CoA kinase